MVQCWYMQDTEGKNKRDALQVPNAPAVTLQDLSELGIIYCQLDADNYDAEGKLAKLKTDRKYNYADIIDINAGDADYEQRVKRFFSEHIHLDEEIRFILEGSGYFDVRNKQDKWIRILLGKGDLVILPAGIYHRFTLDQKGFARMMRLFQGEPVWTAYFRPDAEKYDIRQNYVKALAA